jgi:hypothetical protein
MFFINNINKLLKFGLYSLVMKLGLISTIFIITTAHGGIFFDSIETKLFKAIDRNDINEVKSILAQNKNIKINAFKNDSSKPWIGTTPLIWSVKKKFLEIASVLLENSDNHADPDLGNPLAIAVENCDGPLIQLLIKAGAQMNGVSRIHISDLAHQKCNEPIQKMLIDLVDWNKVGLNLKLAKNYIGNSKIFRKMALEKKLVNSPQDLIDLYSHFEINLSVPQNILEMFFNFKQSPTYQQIKKFQLLLASHDSNMLSLLAQKKYQAQNPVEFLDFFLKDKSDEKIKMFFSFNPLPNIEQIKRFSFNGTIAEKRKIFQEVISKNYILSPENFFDFKNAIFINNYTKSMDINDEDLELFLNLTPEPSIDEIVKFYLNTQSLELKNKIRKLIYDKKYIKVSRDFILVNFALFGGRNMNDSNNHHNSEEEIDFFFNLVPAPSLSEIGRLFKWGNLHTKNSIRNLVLTRNILKTPEDFFSLYYNFYSFHKYEAYQFSDTEIIHFFNLESVPTLQDIEKFYKWMRYDSKVILRNLILNGEIFKNPQDYIKLFQFIIGRQNVKINPEELDFFQKFLLKLDIQTKNQLISYLDPSSQSKINLFFQKIKLIEIKPQIIARFKKEVRAKLGVNNELQSCGIEKDSPVKFYLLSDDVDKLSEKLNEGKLPRGLADLSRSQCSVCLEEEPILNLYHCEQAKCSGAHYSICSDCRERSFTIQLKNHSFPLHCESCGHEVILSSGDLNRLSLTEKKLDLELGTLRAYHEKVFPGAKDCPAPGCINRFRQEDCDQKGFYQCPCGGQTCFQCQESHWGLTCQEHAISKKGDMAMDRLIHDPTSDFRPCPYCFKVYAKNEKCSHVTCANKNCGKKWDFIGGRGRSDSWEGHPAVFDKIGPDGQPHCPQVRRYRIPGDVNRKTGAVYTTYQEILHQDF